MQLTNEERQLPSFSVGVNPNRDVQDADVANQHIQRMPHHQSAESRISVTRLRCRVWDHTTTTKMTTIRPSPVLTTMAVDAQSLIVFNVHSFTAPMMAANPAAPVASLIVVCELNFIVNDDIRGQVDQPSQKQRVYPAGVSKFKARCHSHRFCSAITSHRFES